MAKTHSFIPFLLPQNSPGPRVGSVCESPIKGDLLQKVMSCFFVLCHHKPQLPYKGFHSTGLIGATAGPGPPRPPKSALHKCLASRKKNKTKQTEDSGGLGSE